MEDPSDSLVKITQPTNDKIRNSTEVAALQTWPYLPGPLYVLMIDVYST